MPLNSDHCRRSLERYGVEGRDVHSWMDEAALLYGASHRQYRHDLYQSVPKIFIDKYGGELAQNIMIDHILYDKEKTINKKEITVNEKKINKKEKIKRKRGRRSKGEIAIEFAENGDDWEGTFWVVYDFEGTRNPSKFYRNLAYVLGRYAGERIQKSVVEMRSLRGARAVEALARSYGAKVQVARTEKI